MKIPYEEDLELNVSTLALPDAYDKEVSLSSFKGQVLVLSGGGQGSISEGKKWDAALHKEAEARGDFKFIAIGFVGKLPPFVPKGMIKEQVKKGPMTLLDWKGEAEKLLGLLSPNFVHVFVVDKEGFLRYKLVDNYSPSGVQKVLQKVESLK